ncbi:MAG: PAS domain-containing protein [Bradyrhizobium sp.]|jgi:PAS domain-containing protein|uniref:PAS domain-containing protein n=1 Tax=Bradyrhizobium sp. TaxID=376 RepID=UPI001A35FE06|nr:PAS domain-containing protein [Bradyrhizobium sp.]MBJ7407719.1 PAS domain-containing protein [Bradyrhizobium sp.]
MQKFICEQNIANFERMLSETSDPALQRTLERLLATNKRELALIESEEWGVRNPLLAPPRATAIDVPGLREQLLSDFADSPHPYMLLDPGPRLQIIDINAAYAAATLTDRHGVVGRSLFEVFPDNPDDPLAKGVSNLFASLRTVATTGRAHAMAIQRYDIRGPDGAFIERHWQPINSPIHDRNGGLAFLLHHVEDVTDQVER